VLAAGTDRVTEPRGEGYFHRLRGWAEGISGSYRSGVSADRGATLHRASGAGFAELPALEVTQASGGGLTVDLSCGHGGRSRATFGGTGGEVEGVSQREPSVAAELGAHHAILQLPAGYPQGDLHDQQR